MKIKDSKTKKFVNTQSIELANKIKNGEITIDDVDEILKKEVELLLK